jgi:hypothetical protein
VQGIKSWRGPCSLFPNSEARWGPGAYQTTRQTLQGSAARLPGLLTRYPARTMAGGGPLHTLLRPSQLVGTAGGLYSITSAPVGTGI